MAAAYNGHCGSFKVALQFEKGVKYGVSCGL